MANSAVENLRISDDGIILNNSLNYIKAVNRDLFMLNIDNASEENVRCALEVSSQICLLLNKRCLYSIWQIVSNLQPVQEITISAKELSWRKKDLAQDIQDFYDENIPKCNKAIDELKTPFNRLYSRTCIQKLGSYVNTMSLEMVDLNQRLSILMHIIKSTTASITNPGVHTYDQLKYITKSAWMIKSSFKSKTAGKREFNKCASLIRRMFVFLNEVDLTNLTEMYQTRYNHIVSVLESPLIENEEVAEFRKIVSALETLKEDINEYNSMCKMKCDKYGSMFDLLECHGGSSNYYCCKKICNFMLHISNFFDEIIDSCQQFNHRMVQIKLSMFENEE